MAAEAHTLQELLADGAEASEEELSDSPLGVHFGGDAGGPASRHESRLLEEGELPSELGDGERSRKPPRQAPAYSVRVKAAARQLSGALGEKKVHVLRELCARFGVPLATELLKETLSLQEQGGATTADGSRKRSAGGVFLSLFKARVPAPAWRECQAAIKRLESKPRR